MLLVDEDPVERLAIDRQLELLGWETYGAPTGFEAIRTLSLPGVSFDALLVALRLPDMFGPSVAAAAAQLMPAARVIVLVTEPPAIALDAPFLVKPCSTAALALALRTRPGWN